MTYAGAAGDTAKQMSTALHFTLRKRSYTRPSINWRSTWPAAVRMPKAQRQEF